MDQRNKLNEKTHNAIFTIVGIFLSLLAFLCLGYFDLKLAIIILPGIFFLLTLLKSGKLSFNYLPILLLFCSVLCPPIRFESAPYIRLELILILIAWPLLFLGNIARGASVQLKKLPIYKWFFVFGSSILISIFWNWIFTGFTPTPRDFFEIAKLLEYFLIFLFVVNLDINSKLFKKIYIFSICIFLISALFGLIQYFDFFHEFNEFFIEYIAPNHLNEWIRHRRVVGTTGNPNEFGMLMVIAFSLSLIGFLWTKKINIKIFSLVSFCIFSFIIFLTLSRSALILLLVSLLIILWKYFSETGPRGRIKLALFFLPIIIILGIIVIQFAPAKFFVRIRSAIDIGSDVSFQNRLVLWKDNIDSWKQSPLFGWGPGKETMTTIVDNEWLLLLRRYGLVGLTIFVIWFWKFYSQIGKIKKRQRNSIFLNMFSIFLQVTLMSAGIYMIPSAFYHSLQLMPILMTFLGLVYSSYFIGITDRQEDNKGT